MEWQEISSAETISAKKAPDIIDEKIYESLYEELKLKCNPNRFMMPYDEQRVKLANELYRQLLETSSQDENALRKLRNRAIEELGVYFSTTALYQYLCDKCHPRNFMNPYDAEKVDIANRLYAQVLEQAYNIKALENIQQSAKQLLGIKEDINMQKEDMPFEVFFTICFVDILFVLIVALVFN